MAKTILPLKHSNEHFKEMLKQSEDQFKLAAIVWGEVISDNLPLIGAEWSYGRHTMKSEELSLTSRAAKKAAKLLEWTTTYVIATVTRESLYSLQDKDDATKQAFIIADLIRNAFAHDPIHPQWLIDRKYKGKVFEIDNVIRLDTKNLKNKEEVNWRDYGGHLAILKFSQYVRTKLL